MPVIAMTREMGSRGKDVALGVAERLGLEIVHHEIVEQSVARKMRLTEGSVHRFLEGEASLWERWKIDGHRLSRYTTEEILEIALGGNVIIRGWGAAQLLASVPHVVRVRVCAPMSARVPRWCAGWTTFHPMPRGTRSSAAMPPMTGSSAITSRSIGGTRPPMQ